MSSILLVTPFAPQRDGIATYAAQELQQLRSAGHKVDIVSPQASAAHYHVPLGNAAGVLKLIPIAQGYDLTILQFAPEMLFGSTGTALARAGVWAALGALAHKCRLDLRLHEVEYDVLAQSPVERMAAKQAISRADRVTVHTETEANQLADVIGVNKRKVEVIEQGGNFVVRTSMTRRQAKESVGLDPDRFAFVSIGFLQHHKGFDLAAKALVSADVGGAELHIVGSRRITHPEIDRYVDQLKRQCDASPRLAVHERFVSSDEFDQWIRGADAVVLPYRQIWSSSVIERAQMLGTRVIASDLPELSQQARGDTLLVADLDELRVAMEKVVAAAGYPAKELQRRRTVDDPSWQLGESSRDGTDSGGQVASINLQNVQDQVEERARASAIGMTSGELQASERSQLVPSETLMALGAYHQPKPVSHRVGVSRIKRTVLSLINWQLAPMIQRIEDLHRATSEAVVRLEYRQGQMLGEPIDVTDSENRGLDRRTINSASGNEDLAPTDPFLTRELREGRRQHDPNWENETSPRSIQPGKPGPLDPASPNRRGQGA